MPILHCRFCHHEWEGQAESKCDWCEADSRILKAKSELEEMLEMHDLDYFINRLCEEDRAKVEKRTRELIAEENQRLRKSAQEWLDEPEYTGIIVLDPDGWDRTSFADSWNEKITKEEFQHRLTKSTCLWRRQ